eukprot:XP_001698851.1 predicted protein [Chlamydomonas reinhardtii]
MPPPPSHTALLPLGCPPPLCSQYSVDVLGALCRHCPQLRSLVVRGCSRLCELAVIQLYVGDLRPVLGVVGRAGGSLRLLDLAVVPLTDADLLPLLGRCGAVLASLNVGCCPRLTDALLAALGRACAGSLTGLDVCYAEGMTAAGVRAVAAALPRLTDFGFSGFAGLGGIPRLTDASLRALAASPCVAAGRLVTLRYVFDGDMLPREVVAEINPFLSQAAQAEAAATGAAPPPQAPHWRGAAASGRRLAAAAAAGLGRRAAAVAGTWFSEASQRAPGQRAPVAAQQQPSSSVSADLAGEALQGAGGAGRGQEGQSAAQLAGAASCARGGPRVVASTGGMLGGGGSGGGVCPGGLMLLTDPQLGASPSPSPSLTAAAAVSRLGLGSCGLSGPLSAP